MSSDAGYEYYLNLKKTYAAEHKDSIAIVNKSTATPQVVLLAKTVANELISGDSGYKTTDEGFFFTEELVNKLMHFAYLQGQKQISDESHRQGWADCIADIQKVFAPLAEKLDYSSTSFFE